MTTLRSGSHHFTRFIIALLLGVFLVGATSVPAQAADASKKLGVTKFAQNKNMWCWIAAVETVIEYKTGVTHSQCGMFKTAMGRSLSSTCSAADGKIGDGVQGRMSLALLDRYLGKNVYTAKTGKMTWTALKSNIDNKYPVIVTLAFNDKSIPGPNKATGVYHNVTVYGYAESGGVQYVYVSNAPQRSISRIDTVTGHAIYVSTGVQPSAKQVKMKFSTFMSNDYYAYSTRLARY